MSNLADIVADPKKLLEGLVEAKGTELLTAAITASPLGSLIKAMPGGVGAVVSLLMPKIIDLVYQAIEYAQKHELPVVVSAEEINFRVTKID